MEEKDTSVLISLECIVRSDFGRPIIWSCSGFYYSPSFYRASLFASLASEVNYREKVPGEGIFNSLRLRWNLLLRASIRNDFK